MNWFELSNLWFDRLITIYIYFFHSQTETVLTNKQNKLNIPLARKTFFFFFLLFISTSNPSWRPQSFVQFFASVCSHCCLFLLSKRNINFKHFIVSWADVDHELGGYEVAFQQPRRNLHCTKITLLLNHYTIA